MALRTITNLIAQHGEPPPQTTGFPSDGRHLGIRSSPVLSALKGSIYSDREGDAPRAAWGRLRTKLHRRGLIGVNDGFVWLPDARTDSGGRTRPDAG